MADPFLFELVSPERLLLSVEATEVVVPGAEGQFTVLKGHAPLMSTLRPGVVEAKLATGGSERIFVRGGFADATPDALTILAEQAIKVADLDAATLAQEIKNAEEDVADATDDATRAAATLRRDQLREVQAVLNGGSAAAH
jgi:F-type H+-transporting ATPase subunit epsilon